jgi:hypothetical protein
MEVMLLEVAEMPSLTRLLAVVALGALVPMAHVMISAPAMFPAAVI